MYEEIDWVQEEDKPYSTRKDEFLRLLKDYAWERGMITEEEHKHGLTESKLLEIIKQIPIRILGIERLNFVRDNEKIKKYMSNKMYDALIKRLASLAL